MSILTGKAGLTVCLFLCYAATSLSMAFAATADNHSSPVAPGEDQWTFGEHAARAYDLVFQLNLA